MKKILAGCLILALSLTALAGCGGKETADTNTEAARNGGEKAPAVKVLEIDLTQEEYAFGIDKDQPELQESVNAFIKEIKENGTLDAICDKYFGDGEPTAVKSAKQDDSKDQLIVATNAAFEPFEYTAGQDYYGFDMEIAAPLA